MPNITTARGRIPSKSPKNLKDYMTIRAAAEYVGVSPDSLRRWDRAGKLRAYRHPLNRYRLYLKTELSLLLRGLQTQAKAQVGGR